MLREKQTGREKPRKSDMEERSRVDWNACFNDLKARYPEIRNHLEKEIDKFIEHGIIGHSIDLLEFPPKIEISFLVHPDNFSMRYWDKIKVNMGNTIGEVATKHNLRAYSGYGRGQNYIFSDKDYTLKPNYQDFKKKQR